jgi:hypothetical protein
MTKIRLTERDKKILVVVLLGGALLLILQAGVLPFMERKARLEKGIASRLAAIPEMLRFETQYHATHQGGSAVAQRLAAQGAGFSLFPFLEAKSSEAGVADKIKYMKPMTAATTGDEPSESLVEMKLEGVSLEQLLGYLGKIEVPEQLISIKRISIQQGVQTASLLDVVVQVASLGK